MSMDAYTGEFLVSPIPLELWLHHCSHNCHFCFANLNANNARKADVQAIQRRLVGFRKQTSYVSRLMQWEYPVCVSNHVDPFANTNYRVAVPLFESMVNLGVPVQIQTRGGRGVDDVLSFLPPSVWYISFTSLDDAVRKRLEPGAPTIPERLALIEQLTEKGHRVTVGINPNVPEWLGDPTELLTELQARGVHGIWTERLHFNYKQVRAMTKRGREEIGEAIIKRAQQRRTHELDMESVLTTRDIALELGLEIFSVGQPNPSNFFDVYHETYEHTFPVMQDWINELHSTDQIGTLLTFEQFRDFFVPKLPQGKLPIDCYLGASAHNLWWDTKIPPQMTFEQLLAIIWQDHRIKYCPVRLPGFAWAAVWDETDPAGWVQLVDAQGLPYLIYAPDPFTDYYVHVDVAREDLGPLQPAAPRSGSGAKAGPSKATRKTDTPGGTRVAQIRARRAGASAK